MVPFVRQDLECRKRIGGVRRLSERDAAECREISLGCALKDTVLQGNDGSVGTRNLLSKKQSDQCKDQREHCIV